MTENFSAEIIVNIIKAKKQKKSERHLINFMLGPDVYFSDDFWNLNYKNTNNREKAEYRFDLSSIGETYRFYLKILIIKELFQKKNSFNSAQRAFSTIKTVTKVLMNDKILDVSLITKKWMEQYFIRLYEKDRKPSYIGKLARYFSRFIKIAVEYDEIEADELTTYLDYVASKCDKYNYEKSANDYIPDQFLNQIVSLAVKDYKNDNLSVKDRIFACLLVIIAETGMRREELILLETGQLEPKGFGDKKAYYLNFLTFKTVHYKTEGKKTMCILTDIAIQAYKTCERLVKQTIDQLGIPSKDKLFYYLHTGEKVTGRDLSAEQMNEFNKLTDTQLEECDKQAKRYLYISTTTGFQITTKNTLIERLEQFMIRHIDDFNLEDLNEEDKSKVQYFRISSKSKYEKFFSKDQKTIYPFKVIQNIEYPYVNFHRFRVTVCTKLFRQGIPLDYIMRHMNHVSEDMTLYYNKSQEFDDGLEENIKMFSEIANEDGLLETNIDNIKDDFWKSELGNEDVNRKIIVFNEFLEKNKLNIKDDIGKILKILRKQNTIVAENEFGICIRSLLQGLCERKKYFSSMTDNYFIGIQLNTYKFLPYTYKRFQKKKEIIKHNQKIVKEDPQFQHEYERELKSLKWFVQTKLAKELELLEEDIKLNGHYEIINDHPELEEFIDNVDVIKGEIQEWMKS